MDLSAQASPQCFRICKHYVPNAYTPGCPPWGNGISANEAYIALGCTGFKLVWVTREGDLAANALPGWARRWQLCYPAWYAPHSSACHCLCPSLPNSMWVHTAALMSRRSLRMLLSLCFAEASASQARVSCDSLELLCTTQANMN